MPSTTSYRPCLAANADWRHRLGWTVVGASPERNEYTSLSHHTAVGSLDYAGLESRDETPVGVGEVPGVIEQQRVQVLPRALPR